MGMDGMGMLQNGNGWNGNDNLGMLQSYRMGVDGMGMLQNGNDNIQNGNVTEQEWMKWE